METEYRDRLKSLLIGSLKGFIFTVLLFGAIIGAIKYNVYQKNGTFDAAGTFSSILYPVLIFSPLFIAFACGKKGNCFSDYFHSIGYVIRSKVTGIFDQGIIIAALRFIFYDVCLAPVTAILLVLYPSQLIYSVIMSILEKRGVLDGKEKLCSVFDKLSVWIFIIIGIGLLVFANYLIMRK